VDRLWLNSQKERVSFTPGFSPVMRRGGDWGTVLTVYSPSYDTLGGWIRRDCHANRNRQSHSTC